MGAFKKLKQTDKLVLKQRGGTVVFLESNDDFEIIAQRWFFNEGEDIWFQPADSYEKGAGGGGCSAVIDLVDGARSDGIRAFGIVDRDVLLNDQDWLLWWEHQDDVFLAARPYGNHIRVLLRWELENYLLDPGAMSTVANDAGMTSRHSSVTVVTSCLECAEELKDRTAASVAARAENVSPPATAYGCNPLLCGVHLAAGLELYLTNKGVSDAGKVMQDARAKIDRFDPATAPPAQRWECLLRMLDGKAAFKYVSRRTDKPFDDNRATLARRLFEAGAVPTEIAQYISEFKVLA